ncbi:MAG TPA: hypothetical protein VFC17_04765 [Candidatus Limnocylindrales bacterium]|nr:hypothetical protein [Candidatus Limnocylindrales bacterium]
MKNSLASSRASGRVVCLLWLTVMLLNAAVLKVGAAPGKNTIYDPNPNQLWNRLNETLFVRTAQDGKKYGLDELDILYWGRTTNLLAGTSHHKALAILDEFIHTHGEKQIHDPLKRALLQRDLWELFDWSTGYTSSPNEKLARRELQSRLAIAIRRLALATNEIAALPDDYARTTKISAPDLPAGLNQTNGDWLSVSDQNDLLTVPTHVASFRGHSTFQVLVRFPEGRQAAIAYLDQLRRFEHVWIYVTNDFATTNEAREILSLNPNLPQFPTNTDWALVRRMCVIDADGNIQPTPVMESVQMRRCCGIGDPTFEMVTNMDGSLDSDRIPPIRFYEFQMNRRQNCELREIGQNEKDFNFVHFMGMGFDQFQYTSRNASNEVEVLDSAKLQSITLDTCRQCHRGQGLFSVNSYTRFLSFFSESPQRPANLTPLDFNREIESTIFWKQRQFDWGLLQGLWHQEN